MINNIIKIIVAVPLAMLLAPFTITGFILTLILEALRTGEDLAYLLLHKLQ